MTTDRFGVPGKVFGAHDEDFFSALGRVAALSALVEHQALGTFQTMTNALQSEHSQLPAGQLIEKACKALLPINDDQDKQTLQRYFKDVSAALRERNDYIHNLWPAQPGDRLFGWRHSRVKNAPADKQYESLETTMDELRDFILRLVELIQRRDRVYVAACALQQLELSGGASS